MSQKISQPGRLRLNHVLSIKCAISLVATTEEWKVKSALPWLALPCLPTPGLQKKAGPRQRCTGTTPASATILPPSLPLGTHLDYTRTIPPPSLPLGNPKSMHCLPRKLDNVTKCFSVKLQTEQGALMLECEKESLRKEEGGNPHQTAESRF